jgi:hypothetical membrane protein
VATGEAHFGDRDGIPLLATGLSPDGDLLVIGDDITRTALCDLATGTRRELDTYGKAVAVDWLPDGSGFAVVTLTREIYVFDREGEPVAVAGHPDSQTRYFYTGGWIPGRTGLWAGTEHGLIVTWEFGSPISQPISGLGLGATAPYMNTAFILGGLLTTIGTVAAMATTRADRPLRMLCTVLMAMPGIGMILAGVFDLESMMPHLTGFLLATGVPVAGFLVTGIYLRGIPRWRRFGTALIPAALLTLVLLTAFFATFDPTAAGANTGIAGLVQRTLAVEVHGWLAAMGWLAYRGR